MLVKLHFVKYADILKFLLNYLFDDNPFQESDVSISLKQVIECHECISNKSLCWFHTESLKASIISDVQKWIKDCKIIQKNECF